MMEDSTRKIKTENRETLLKREIIFQGQRMLLGHVLQADSQALDEISLSELSLLEEIGKSLEFDELKLHIDRKFLRSTAEAAEETQSSVLNSEELLRFVEGKKVVLLSDEAGKGKTTELQLLGKLMKLKYPKHWLMFTDLTDGAFGEQKNLETPKAIAQFFCDEILKINGIAATVFINLFNEGRVIILMDGFDEINSSVSQLVLKLTQLIKEQTENQVWIATRPQTEAELREKLDGEAFKIKPFDHHDLEAFAKALLLNEADQPENHEEKTHEVQGFLFGLNSYRSNKIEEPIIFRLLMEAYDVKCSTQLNQQNYFPLFKSFVDAMIEKFLRKAERSDEVENIFAFHQKHALISIFEEGMKGSKELIENHFAKFKLPPIGQMTKVGFISSNGAEEIKFLDLTLAEFFAADFFYKNIFLLDGSKDENIVALFKSLWAENTSYRCRMVTIFLNSVFETSTSDELAKFQEIFVQILPEKFLQEVFRLAVFDNCLNLIKIISLIFKDQKKTLFEMWSVRRFGTNALMMAVEGQRIDYIERIIMIAHDVLAPKHFKELFYSKSSLGSPNIYFAAASGIAQGAAAFIVKHRLNPLSDKETKQFLTAKAAGGINILIHSCEMTTDLRELKTIFEVVKEKCSQDDLTKMMLGSGKSLLFHALPSIKKPETFNWLSNCFKERFTIEELKKMFNNEYQSEDAKFSLVHIAIQWNVLVFKAFFSFLDEIFPERSDLKKVLALDFHNGVTMFHYATENADDEAFMLIKSKYAELFSIEEMKEMILRAEIFFIAMQGYDNEKTIAALWGYMLELFDVETLKQVLLKKELDKKFSVTFWQSEKRFNDVVAIFDSFVDKYFTQEEAIAFRAIPPPDERRNPNDRFWS